MNNIDYRELLKDKKRIVVKIGSSSITHQSTGNLNYKKLERLVRILCDLRNEGKDIVLVSSGAIAVGKQAAGLAERPRETSMKQACAAVGQCRLMMTYEKLFSEYNQLTAQVLLTKYTFLREESRINTFNTFEALFQLGAIPIVNENDTVATHEIEMGDNDRLSAFVTALVSADLLILLSDIDGLYTDDPNKNPDAEFIELVPSIDERYRSMGKDSSSNVGTGGMAAKIQAATIATKSGAQVVIANSKDIDNISNIIEGQNVGTLFVEHKDPAFTLADFL